MRNYLIGVFIFLFVFRANAQEQDATITGTIRDSKTGESLIGVAISVDSIIKGVSDLSGNYSIDIIPGKHLIGFKQLSFEPYSQTVTVSAGEKKSFNVFMTTSSKELNTVVISAGKFEQKIEDVTVSMEVMKPSVIESRNTVNMEDAVEKFSGVSVVDGQANIRGGSGWSYGAGSRVQILVDDLPQLTADANDAKWNFIPVENLEQVEVIKGASSVLFGSSALNGVINIRTAYPKDKPITKFSFFAGIYDDPKFTIDGKTYDLKWWGTAMLTTSGYSAFHSQKIDRLDIVAGANVFDDQGYREGEKERRQRFNLNTRYRFKKIEGLSVGVNLNTMKSSGTLFFLFQNDTSGAYTPAINTLSTYRSTRTNVDPFVTYTNKKIGTIKLRTRWFNTVNLNNTNQSSHADLYYSELQYQKSFKEKLVVTAGLLDVNSVIKSELYGDHDGTQIAAYAQGDWKIGKLNVSAGARIEQNRIDTVSDKMIPVFRSGVNYHLFKGTYLRASVGQGYRFPSVAEKYVKTNVGSLVVYPNSQLDPEKGISYELGIRQLFKYKKWSGFADIAFFRNEYTDMMEFSFGRWGTFADPLFGNGFKSINIGDTRIDGVEGTFGITGTVGKDWTFNLSGGITYIDGRQLNYDSAYVALVGGMRPVLGSDSTDALKYRSKTTYKADLSVTWKKAEIGLGMRYTSRMENIDYVFVSGLLDFAFAPGLGIGHYRKYHRYGDIILDMRTSYAFNDKFKLAFIIKNLTNYIYMQRPADTQAPRQFVLQLNVSL